MKYGILGTGRFGTALAKLLGNREEVYLWGRDEALVKRIQFDRTNEVYLPGFELPYEVRATYDLKHVLDDSDVIISAVPSGAFTQILEESFDYLSDLEAFITATTGFTPASGRRLSQEYRARVELLDNYFALGGPARPNELVDKHPSNLEIAGKNDHNRKRLAEIFYRNHLRLYETDDLIGHEISTSINNLLAVVGGLVEGLDLKNGTRASLLVRGVHETKRLVEYEGGNKETVYNMGGLGGALSIGTSHNSRNFRLGESLAAGKSLEAARSAIAGCLESITISRSVHRRILKGEIKAPLLTELYGIIHEGLDPFKSIQKIINLKRPPEEE